MMKLPMTAVLRGQIYEKLAKAALESKFPNLSMTAVGRQGDRGIDLIGRVCNTEVLVQCKSTSSKAPGLLWRELIGVCSRSDQSLNMQSDIHKKALGILVSPLPMTPIAHTEFMASTSPLVHCVIPFPGLKNVDPSSVIRALVLNRAAEGCLDMLTK